MRSFEFALEKEDGKTVMEKGEDGILRCKKAFPNAQLPEYQTKHSAGADFFCAQRVFIPSVLEQMHDHVPIVPTLVHTGIKASMGPDEVLEIVNRSSNPKKGLVLANGVGIIDADYYGNPDNDGEIMFAFYNLSPVFIEIEVGDRIGQGVFKKVLRPEEGLRVKDVERAGGLGSTGVKSCKAFSGEEK